MQANDIFTPGSLPDITYYERSSLALEQALQNALNTKGIICSITGPSKCGKTVLCEKVIGQDNMLLITGAGLNSIDRFWEKLRQQLNTSKSFSRLSGTTYGGDITGTAEASGGIPLIAQVKGGVSGKFSISKQDSISRIFDDKNSKALFKLIREINLTLVIDDFHYATPEVQKILAQEFKEATRELTRIVIVSVPHRSDQIIRANPDLRGRLRLIDIPYWQNDELLEIPKRGFRKLGITVDENTLHFLVRESVSSPQLMQTLCLDFCYSHSYQERQNPPIAKSLNSTELKALLEKSSTNTDCSTAYAILKSGAKTRGSQRNSYHLSDGKIGDIYTVVLKAIAKGEVSLSFSYEDLKGRVESVIAPGADIPRGSDLTSTLIQMDTSIRTKSEEDRVLEYDKEKEQLVILDPYFLYYLRWASKA